MHDVFLVSRQPRQLQSSQYPLSDWFNRDAHGFQSRIIAQQVLPANSSDAQHVDLGSHPAPGSSLAVSSRSRTMTRSEASTSTRPPSLITSEVSTANSADFSLSTGLASALSGFRPFDTETGQPQTPRAAPFECAFFFLSCGYSSDNFDEWKTHCMSHFRGNRPPKDISCPLCPFHGTFRDGYEAWDTRLNHVAQHHLSGHSLAASRPDFDLYRFLWRKEIIGDVDHKELRTTGGRLSRREAYTTGHQGRRR